MDMGQLVSDKTQGFFGVLLKDRLNTRNILQRETWKSKAKLVCYATVIILKLFSTSFYGVNLPDYVGNG
jgi:hypothetical protein